MKIISLAKFAAGAGGATEAAQWADKYGSPHASHPVISPAVIQIEGLNFESPRPTSAGHAEQINRVVRKACGLGYKHEQ